jgi:hypothetical protein
MRNGITSAGAGVLSLVGTISRANGFRLQRDFTNEIEPDEWRSALDFEFKDQSAMVKEIGKQLRFELAKTIGEPSPLELRDQLNALEAKLDGKTRPLTRYRARVRAPGRIENRC